MRDARFRDLRTVPELRELYRFPSDKAVRTWLARHHVARRYRGRTLLVDTRDVDAALRHAPHRRALALVSHFPNLEERAS